MSTEATESVAPGKKRHSLLTVRPLGEHNIFEPYGPFSPATVALDKVVYTSGQIGVDSKSGILVGGGPKHEARVVLENLKELLKMSGVSMRNVAKVTLYLTDMAHMKPVLEAYKEYFRDPCPALAILQVTGLPLGATVQMDAIGYLSPPPNEFTEERK